MNDHTKEPWRQGKASDSVVVDCPPDVNPNDPCVVHYGGHLICESASAANVRRIVACVNACAGIPTELIEQGGFAAVPVATHREVKQQRDDLLAAWNAACAFIDSHAADPDITSEMCKTYAVFQQHRSAIANAEKQP